MMSHYCSLTEIENMMPWERDIYISIINNYIVENKQKNNQNG